MEVQGFKADADQVPRKRSAAVSAKAARLRSQDALPAANAAAEAEAERAAAALAARAQQWRREQVGPALWGSRQSGTKCRSGCSLLMAPRRS
jgi:hypothetical protein